MKSSINKTKLRQARVVETSFSVVSRGAAGKQINNFKIIKTLGVGQYGKVYLAQNLETNETRAIKAIKRARLRKIGQANKDATQEI